MKKICLLIVLAFFTVSTVSATTISSEKVTVDLEENEITAVLDVESLTTETFNYQTSHPVRDLQVKVNGENVGCSVEDLAVGSTINCETDSTENFTVNINYETQGLVSSQDNIDIFRYSQSIYRPVDSYTFRAVLPEGTGVVDQEDATTSVIVPKNGKVGNMNGRRFYVEWTTNPQLGESQNFKVLFEPFQERENDVLIPSSIIAAAIIAAIGYFVYKRKNKVNATNTLEELGEDEQMVVKMLQESESEMLQKNVVDQSNYSKAKISGVVSTLVEKDIVRKEKEGRSNKVSLREKFRN